jgi:outer membrane protein TolC
MTWNRPVGIWLLAAPLALAGVIAGAAPAHAQQISDAYVRELIKEAMNPARQAKTPATVPPSFGKDTRPVVALTIDDAVKFALDRNLDIAVQRENPEISDLTYASIRSVYLPLLSSTIAQAGTTNPSTSTIAGGQPGAPINTGLVTYNGALTQSVPWGGGALSVQLNNLRQTSTASVITYNPVFSPAWTGQYTQPLLRNFSTDFTRRTLKITKLNRDISEVQLKSTITNIVSNVRDAYWDYVYAVESVDVAQQSLDLANQLVKDNQARVDVGTLAPIDVVTAQSQAATAKQNLVAAQSQMSTAELALKRLIVGGTNDPNWSVKLNPVDRPDFVPQTFDIEAAVRRALSERTDLTIAKMNVQQNDLTMRYLVDQLKPQADFVASYGFSGIGGTQLLFGQGSTGIGGARQIVGTVPGGYGDALSSLFGGTYPRWNAQLNFSYPLGVSQQRALVARSRVALNQIAAQTKQIELQIATDVTNAALTAQSNAERVQAAQSARELAQEQLKAEQSKFEVGMSTNYNVILSQRDLATAQTNELQAVLNYRKSLVELDRLQQTTLTSQNITILATQ